VVQAVSEHWSKKLSCKVGHSSVSGEHLSRLTQSILFKRYHLPPAGYRNLGTRVVNCNPIHWPIHPVCPDFTPSVSLSKCQCKEFAVNFRGDFYETVTFKTRGVNITTCVSTY
jgi:hypothetical protein